ncbi:MAG TPA: hypothetical protein VF530_02540 [Planctomycetota bacterium]
MSARGGLAALLLAALAAPPAAQGPAEADASVAPALEGPLDNDVFVPVSEPAQAALTEGDAALARARATPAGAAAGERERHLDSALDAWQSALARTGAGTWCWFDPTPGAAPRLCEGVRAAVERRLLALEGAERRRWSQRHEPAASAVLARLERAPPEVRAPRAAELVRAYPLTLAAARAALQLGDLALAAGLRARARGWYVRAELEAELAGEPAALAAALGPRLASSAAGPAPRPETWRTATGASFAGQAAYPPAAPRGGVAPAAERRARPGGTFLADGRFALQTFDELRLIELAASGAPSIATRLRLDELLGPATPELAFDVPRAAPGWPLLPAATGEHLALVVGRTQGEEPNVLLVLELAEPRPHAGLGLSLGRPAEDARVAWTLVGSELLRGEEAHAVPALAELEPFEFQPGPVASADRFVVQLRKYDGRVRAWLAAFERHDGSLAWLLELAGGAERVPTQRFAAHAARVSAQPLLAFELDGEPRVFAGTHLGLGALVDGLTGEPLYGLKNRRRAEHEAGWSGERPLLATEGSPAILWAPADSDRLYALRPFALAGAGDEEDAVWVAPPAPLLDARTLLGGDAREHLVHGSAGRERTVSARRAGQDRIDALDLGEDERFRGTGLVSAERAWVATDRGLYLFDRTRELYLLDSQLLPPAGEAPGGGDLHAHDAHVLVVGTSALWTFRTR